MSTAVATRAGGRRQAGGSGAGALLLPPAVLLVLALAIPLVAVLARAAGDLGLGGVVSEPLASAAFREGVLTTLVLAAATTLAALVVGVVYALAMAVARPGLARTLSAVLLLTFWISLLVRTYGWLLALQPNGGLDYLVAEAGLTSDGLGLFQTMPGLVAPMVHILLPYMVLPIYAGIQAIDPTTCAPPAASADRARSCCAPSCCPRCAPARWRAPSSSSSSRSAST